MTRNVEKTLERDIVARTQDPSGRQNGGAVGSGVLNLFRIF